MSKKLKFSLSYAPNYLMFVFGLILLGFQSFIMLDFDLYNVILRWLSIVVRFSALIMLLLGSLNLTFENCKEVDAEYKEVKGENKNLEKNIKPNVGDYIVEKNLLKKKKTYITNIRLKIEKIDKKASYEDRIIYDKGTLEEKEKNKYFKKKYALLKQLDEEYINANILYLDVDYDYIEERDLYISNDYINDRDDLKKRRGAKQIRLMIPKMMIALGMAILMAVSAPSLITKFSVIQIYTLVMDLFFVWGCISYGISTGKELFREVEMDYEVKKRKFIKEYMEWVKSNPSNNAYDDMLENDRKKIKQEYEDKAREKIKEYIEQDKTIKQEIRA